MDVRNVATLLDQTRHMAICKRINPRLCVMYVIMRYVFYFHFQTLYK